jgi:hypothetical protein
MIYILGWKESKYHFEAQLSKFNFTTEQIAFQTVSGSGRLLMVDTFGNLHIAEYSIKAQTWKENLSFHTGRIAQIIIAPNQNKITLWGLNRTNYLLELYKDSELKYQNSNGLNALPLKAFYQNDQQAGYSGRGTV